MHFELFQEAAEGDERALDDLDHLLRRVEDGVHELTFDDPVGIEQSQWFHALRPHRQSLVRLLVEAQIWCSPRRSPRVAIRKPADAGPAHDRAMTPLTILVEDDASDGALVMAAVMAYGREKLLRTWACGERAIPRGWTLEHSGGGGNLPRKIRQLGAVPEARMVVVRDSDKEHPNDPHKQEIVNCEAAALALSVRALVLPLREAENYLPDRFWDIWLAEDPARASYQPAIEALKALSADQRDHIDMEGDARIEKGQLGPLFDGSEPSNPQPALHHLRALTGKRKNLKGSGSDKKTKQSRMPIRSLAQYVQARKINATDLDQRDRSRALRSLLALIEEEL